MRTNEIVKSVIITWHFPYNCNICSSPFEYPSFFWVGFLQNIEYYTVVKVCTSPRNSTWLFLSLRESKVWGRVWVWYCSRSRSTGGTYSCKTSTYLNQQLIMIRRCQSCLLKLSVVKTYLRVMVATNGLVKCLNRDVTSCHHSSCIIFLHSFTTHLWKLD